MNDEQEDATLSRDLNNGALLGDSLMLGLGKDDQIDPVPRRTTPTDPKVITGFEERITKRPRKLHRPWIRNKEPWKEVTSLKKQTKDSRENPIQQPSAQQQAVSNLSADPDFNILSLENAYPSTFKRVDSGLSQASPDLDSSMDKLANQSAVSYLPDPKELPSPLSGSMQEKEKPISKFVQMKSASQSLAQQFKPEELKVKKNRIAPGSRPEHLSQASALRRVLKSSMKKKSEEEYPELTAEILNHTKATSTCSTFHTSVLSWRNRTSLGTPG